jgi:hypothetical protein
MNNKFFVILFLGLGFSIKIWAQDCQPSYEKGFVFNMAENNLGFFCFKKDPEPLIDSMPDVYHTKYTIAFGKATEAYNIHFYFYKRLGSMYVKYMNTVSGKTGTEEITFKEHTSIRMFKNYKANDTTISENEQYCTLFTIPDTMRPYVTLNLFQLPDNKNICLGFTQINPEKLLQHRKEAADFFKWEDSVAVATKAEEERRIRHKNTVDSLFRDMNDYKVTVIQKITEDDSLFKMNGPVLEAPGSYLEAFKEKIDPVVFEYFKNIYPYENFDSEIRFTFTCNGEGKMDNGRTQVESVNSLRIKWFEDSFKVNIQPFIEAGVYKTVTAPRANPGLITSFNDKYSDATKYLTENADYKEFMTIRNKIYSDLDKYILSRDISTPTKYTYSVKYRSTVSVEDWIYEINKKGVEKIGPKKADEVISEDLKMVFRNKIAKPNVGKYHIKICRVYLNNKLVGLDIVPEEIKK